MDDSGQRENGRHKADHYKSIHAQWMIPQHQMKDNQALKLMTVMAERDNAIQERNIALSEKKAALAERDMAILQRDAAIAERNTAFMERDNAIAALEYARENSMNSSGVAGCPPGCTAPRGAKHIHHHHSQQHQQHLHAHSGLPPTQLANDPYNHSREMHATDAHPNSTASEGIAKSRKVKRPRKDTKPQQCQAQATAPPKKTKPRKSKRSCGGDDLTKQATFVKPLNDWRSELGGNVENLNKQGTKHHNEWKDQDLGLNQVTFDESTMPVPVCSCTGKYQPCYKWGNGGWQSACCTTTLSMYPLPVMPNKRHARVGGRKMSGTVFTRILSRLAADGHDLSVPVDLKDHWAKHGTNRYITIR